MPSEHVANLPLDLELFFDGDAVGRIADISSSENTYFGAFEESAGARCPARVTEFIAFCRDWHTRMEDNPHDPPSASEFDSYGDLLTTGRWSVRCSQKRAWRLVGAPVFFPDGQIVWRMDSTEAMADDITNERGQ